MPTLSNLTLTSMALLGLVMLWKWQRSHPAFDMSDLITGDNGKVSATKFWQTAASAVATWGFVTLLQQGKMTEFYFVGYMTTIFGVRVLKDFTPKGPP